MKLPRGSMSRSLVVLAACCSLLPQACTDFGTMPSPSPETWRTVNRIYFLSNRETLRSMQVFSMNPDGTDMRRHTYPNDSVTFYHAAPSPALTRLAVVWDFYDLRRREFPSLAMVDTNGNFLYPLVDYCEPMGIAWSPGGDRIGFTRPATSFGGRDDAYFVNAHGGSITRVTNFGVTNLGNGFIDTSSTFLQWVDDNTMLVRLVVDSTYDSSGIQHHNFTVGIHEVDLHGRISRSILLGNSLMYGWASINPNQSKLAYHYSDRNGHEGIGVAERDGSGQHNVAPELNYYLAEHYHQQLTWSPGSIQLSFSASKPLGNSIASYLYLINNDGTGLTTIIADSTFGVSVAGWR